MKMCVENKMTLNERGHQEVRASRGGGGGGRKGNFFSCCSLVVDSAFSCVRFACVFASLLYDRISFLFA